MPLTLREKLKELEFSGGQEDARAMAERLTTAEVDDRVANVHPPNAGMCTTQDSANPSQQFVESGRYSRGFGSAAGAGVEYSLTNSLALTTGLSAMRNRMTTYRLTGPATVPSAGSAYWMTSVRLSLGLKFNPVRSLQSKQNPTQ